MAHLFRFLFSKDRRDVNGVNNGLRTFEQRISANNQSIVNRRLAVTEGPVGRPFSESNQPVRRTERTAAQRAAQSATGKNQQAANSACPKALWAFGKG